MFSNYAALSCITHKVWVCKYTGPGVEESAKLKVKSVKLKIQPNPFTTGVRVQWSGVSKGQKVSLKIYDVSGRLVKELFDKPQNPGHYETTWDGTDEKGKTVASGVYVFKLILECNDSVVAKAKKMLFLKE